MIKCFAKNLPTIVSTTFSVIPPYLIHPEHVLHNYARFPYHHTLSDGATRYSCFPRRMSVQRRAYIVVCSTHDSGTTICSQQQGRGARAKEFPDCQIRGVAWHHW